MYIDPTDGDCYPDTCGTSARVEIQDRPNSTPMTHAEE